MTSCLTSDNCPSLQECCSNFQCCDINDVINTSVHDAVALGTGIIIAIIVGCVVAIALCIAGCVWCCCRQPNRGYVVAPNPVLSTTVIQGTSAPGQPPVYNPNHHGQPNVINMQPPGYKA